MLGWVGAVFFVVGFTDIVLAFVPPAFGVAGWEFATVQRTYDFMPLTTLGLALLLGSAVAMGHRKLLFAVSGLLLLLGVLLVIAGVLYVLSVPFALQQVRQPIARTGLKRALVKAAVQGTLYPIVYLALGAKGLRRALKGPKDVYSS